MLEVLGFLGLLSAGARLKDREAGAEGIKATPSPGNMLMLGDGMSPLDSSPPISPMHAVGLPKNDGSSVNIDASISEGASIPSDETPFGVW